MKKEIPPIESAELEKIRLIVTKKLHKSKINKVKRLLKLKTCPIYLKNELDFANFKIKGLEGQIERYEEILLSILALIREE